MKKTNGGWRAAEFETILAADKGSYLNRNLYIVEGLPGVWRRCRTPRGSAEDAGLLPCWFDGEVIYLEHTPMINEELIFADPLRPGFDGTVPTTEELGSAVAMLEKLQGKRTDFLAREAERVTESSPGATPVPVTADTASHSENQKAPDLDV